MTTNWPENKALHHPTNDQGGPSAGTEEDKQSDLDVPGGKGLVKEETSEEAHGPV